MTCSMPPWMPTWRRRWSPSSSDGCSSRASRPGCLTASTSSTPATTTSSPSSKPSWPTPPRRRRFLICTRDSLLSSNAAMRGFLERQTAARRGGGGLRAGAVGPQGVGGDRLAGAGAGPRRREGLQEGGAVRIGAAGVAHAGRPRQAAVLLHGHARRLQGREGPAEGRAGAVAVHRRPHGGARARQGYLPLARLRRRRGAGGGDRRGDRGRAAERRSRGLPIRAPCWPRCWTARAAARCSS